MACREDRYPNNYVRRAKLAARYFMGFCVLMLISLGLFMPAAVESSHKTARSGLVWWIAGGATAVAAFVCFACHLYHESKIMD